MIETADRGGVRVVALCRPPVNALNLAIAEALGTELEKARDDASVRAVVLTGVPGVFSAGIDTREVPGYDAATRAAMLRAINRAIAELYALAKPVVAAITGHALGGAMVLALACDVRLAARGEFRLGLTEASAGIPFPAGPLAVVRAELSPENVRALAQNAPVAGPDSPIWRGVIDRVVEAPTLLGDAIREAERLAAMPAFARVKAQLRAPTCARLREIVEQGDEPLLERWI